MYLIAESRNENCEWLIINSVGDELKSFITKGINPYFHTTDKIKALLWETDEALVLKNQIKHVFFYGAGCSSNKLKQIVEVALSSFFDAANVRVNHDLVSSAYSSYRGSPVISCILGTGSNSSFFDGENCHEVIPNLAYVLGDEGSGCYFGKIILRDFFYETMPKDIWKKFNSEFRLTIKDVNEAVYRNSDPNVYLASFMPFLARFKTHAYVKNMLIEGFRKFIQFQVKCFPNWSDVEVSFAGSVAIHFEELVKEACFLEEINNCFVINEPLERLKEYHLKYILKKLYH